MKKSQRQKVLICNDTKFFELFHEFLCHTLEELGCETKVSSSWDEFLDELGKNAKDYNLTVIDPVINGFDTEHLKATLKKANAADLASIGIRQHPGSSIQGLVKELGMQATVCKTYPPQDMAFVFNRILFPESNEKRAFPRALMALNVEYKLAKQTEWLFEDTFNVSGGGMFLRSYRENGSNDEIRMKIYLNDEGTPLECLGRVVHRRPHQHRETSILPSGLGIEFTEIDNKDRNRLIEQITPRLLPVDQEES